MTTDEAASILGWPVSADPHGGEAGSVDMRCNYDKPGEIGVGVESALRVPGAFAVDAASQYALASAANNATPVDSVGVKAVCLFEPQTTPPSTTVVVLLSGDRVYWATEGYASCDTLKQFAQVAIGRIGA